MINKIKEETELLKNKKIKFRYNGSRNQVEEFEGTITKCYRSVFVIEIDKFTRSFSYSDVLIGVLELNI